MLQSVEVKINKLYFAETVVVYKYLCDVQGATRHWRNPVRTRVIPLDSSDQVKLTIVTCLKTHRTDTQVLLKRTG
jgi:hypothetical protein